MHKKQARPLHEKWPNTEFFLVHIFPYSVWIRTFCYVNLRIQSEYGKIRTRKNSVFGHFKYGPKKTPYLDTFHRLVFLNNAVWLMILKMKLKMESRSHRYDINKNKSRNGHKYSQYLNYVSVCLIDYYISLIIS